MHSLKRRAPCKGLSWGSHFSRSRSTITARQPCRECIVHLPALRDARRSLAFGSPRDKAFLPATCSTDANRRAPNEVLLGYELWLGTTRLAILFDSRLEAHFCAALGSQNRSRALRLSPELLSSVFLLISVISVALTRAKRERLAMCG